MDLLVAFIRDSAHGAITAILQDPYNLPETKQEQQYTAAATDLMAELSLGLDLNYTSAIDLSVSMISKAGGVVEYRDVEKIQINNGINRNSTLPQVAKESAKLRRDQIQQQYARLTSEQRKNFALQQQEEMFIRVKAGYTQQRNQALESVGTVVCRCQKDDLACQTKCMAANGAEINLHDKDLVTIVHEQARELLRTPDGSPQQSCMPKPKNIFFLTDIVVVHSTADSAVSEAMATLAYVFRTSFEDCAHIAKLSDVRHTKEQKELRATHEAALEAVLAYTRPQSVLIRDFTHAANSCGHPGYAADVQKDFQDILYYLNLPIGEQMRIESGAVTWSDGPQVASLVSSTRDMLTSKIPTDSVNCVRQEISQAISTRLTASRDAIYAKWMEVAQRQHQNKATVRRLQQYLSYNPEDQDIVSVLISKLFPPRPIKEREANRAKQQEIIAPRIKDILQSMP